MKFSVSRIQTIWSSSFTYSLRGKRISLEWVVNASHVGTALRVFIQGADGIRCLNLDGYSRDDLGKILQLTPIDLANNTISTCNEPPLDMVHYFLTVISNTSKLGRSTPVSAEFVMEIMEVAGSYQEMVDPDGMHQYLATLEFLDLEDGARRYHLPANEVEFWQQHWVSISSRIIEESKRGNRRSRQ